MKEKKNKHKVNFPDCGSGAKTSPPVIISVSITTFPFAHVETLLSEEDTKN